MRICLIMSALAIGVLLNGCVATCIEVKGNNVTYTETGFFMQPKAKWKIITNPTPDTATDTERK